MSPVLKILNRRADFRIPGLLTFMAAPEAHDSVPFA